MNRAWSMSVRQIWWRKKWGRALCFFLGHDDPIEMVFHRVVGAPVRSLRCLRCSKDLPARNDVPARK